MPRKNPATVETKHMSKFESFSANASDLLRLRRAIYGPEDAQALMLRCYRRSRGNRQINERTVLNAWSEQDAALKAALDATAEGVL